MVHVWSAKLDLAGWPAADLLPRQERDRAARLRSAERRRRWVAARWALRGVLALYLDQPPAEIRLAGGAHGKPELADAAAGLRFNLSHSEGLALVALARDREVGVDVERIDPRRDPLRLAPRLLDPSTSEAVLKAPAAARLAAFHHGWARREAIGKCAGAGLAAVAPPAAVADLDVGRGFAAALAVSRGPKPRLRRFVLEPGDLPVNSRRPAYGGPRSRSATA